MRKSQQRSPNKNDCLHSVLRYCGLSSTCSLLDQCQDHQFKKRKKISLKNLNIKNKKICTADQSCPSGAHTVGNYIRQSYLSMQQNELQHRNNTVGNYVRQFRKSYLPMQQNELQHRNNTVGNQVRQFRKSYLPLQLYELQHRNKNIYTDVPSMALPLKDIAEKPVNYQTAATSQRKDLVQNRQNKQLDQNYQQEFQRLLFDQNEEPTGQLTQYQSPCILQQKGKKLNSFDIKQSQSLYDSKESSHFSIVLPYTHSHKLTSSTIFHTKTSESVIFTQANHLQTGSIVSRSISDEEFKAINFLNPFKSQKSRVCA